MSSQIREEYLQLVNKFLAGTISDTEMEVLDRYYSLYRDEADITDKLKEEEITDLEQRLQHGISRRIKHIEKVPVPLYNRTWFRVAATVLVCIGVSFLWLRKTNAPQQFAAVTKQAPAITAPVNHFITLPDSSRIVLHHGSNLVVADNFKLGKTREVTLIGEAYFDVKHNNKRPFIIHTGNINVTVLGTAFNIKAYKGQKDVTVTVTRGRVKVERGTDMLAILTPNKQLVASRDKKQSDEAPQNVVATQELAWAKTDMSFDAMPFGTLAEHLNKRYDVKISFKNPELAGCPITGTFNGTESLSEVLDIVSQTRNTSYTINGSNVLIDGKGCK